MSASELQQELFQLIKANIPAHLSATEEIAKVLNVSADSVYRRLRGEKTISLDELQTLCVHYNISIDQLLNIQNDGFFFNGSLIDENTFSRDKYANSILQTMIYFNSFKQKEIYVVCKEMPLFHHYLFPEIAIFKDFFWKKTSLRIPEFKDKKFSFDDFPDELSAEERKILELYNQMKSVEIWNIETMTAILRQIEYYRENHVFKSEMEVYKLYDVMERLLVHLQAQAALGYKFKYGDSERKPLGDYQLYFNEVVLGSNEYLIVLDAKKISIITHTILNSMMTRNVAFNENMYKSINNFMRRSTLISSASEKERSKFFRILHDRIVKRKDALVT